MKQEGKEGGKGGGKLEGRKSGRGGRVGDRDRHQRYPRKFWLAAACFKLLVGGTIIFQKAYRC